MSTAPTSVLTIGHSTHPMQRFLALLKQHGVTVLADVRSSPYSRMNPQFNREALKKEMLANGVKYLFLGSELGGRSDDPCCYEDGRVQYARLARTEPFRTGIERILRGCKDYRIALMCAEKEPLECHRTLLVARALAARGASVEHILADGRLESHEDSLERLLDVVGLPHHDLFRSRDDLISDALARQEARIAYVDEALVGDTGRERR